jgi:two-component system, cell cycle response regulator
MTMTENQELITQTVEIQTANVLLPNKYPCLVVLRGRDIGRRFELRGPRVTIGRSVEANVVFNDEGVSRIHCCIVRRGDSFSVEDLNSRNGTYVDAVRTQQAPVKLGTPIQIGRTLFHLDFKDAVELAYEDNLLLNATTDPLTGILNRRQIMTRAEEELSLAARNATPVVVVMTDIDQFKPVNDAGGHRAGDYVLRKVAGLIGAQIRREDLLGRFGGDEFMLLLRGEVKQAGALAFCEKIRHSIETFPFEHDGIRMNVTVSIGVCCAGPGKSYAVEDLVELADRALYRAKENGRNRVELKVVGKMPE